MPEAGIIHTWTFDQERVWINYKGEEIPLWEIDREYALNIMLFLLRNSKRFWRAYLLQHDAVTDGSTFDTHAWIEEKPLFKALRERVLADDQ